MARKKKKKNVYFSKDTEDAIILYNGVTDSVERNKIYKEDIRPAFEKLVENIIHTFGFYYFDVPSEQVKHEVVSFLIMNIHKYKPGKGKAFSYFSIVTKNYLIHHNNKNYEKYKKHDNLDRLDYKRNILGEHYTTESQSLVEEFVPQMIDYWEFNLARIFRRRKDQHVADAILSLFKERENIENFNKKYLYILIREQTGSKTQHITRIVNIMKKYNLNLKAEFMNCGFIDTQYTGSRSW